MTAKCADVNYWQGDTVKTMMSMFQNLVMWLKAVRNIW